VPREEAKSFGVMSVDENFEIKRFTEKPVDPEPMPHNPDLALASMGIYVFSMTYLTKILIDDAEDEASDHDFGKDIIPKSIESAKAIAYLFLDDQGKPAYWRDVGTLYSYWQANIELCDIEPELNLYRHDWPIWTYQSQSPPAKFAFDDDGRRGMAVDTLVAGGVIVSGAYVRHSVIFFNTKIETGTVIEDSVILPKVTIGSNCVLKRVIVDKGTYIPDGTQIGVDPEKDRERFLVTEEGIVLVTPGMLNQRLHFERDG